MCSTLTNNGHCFVTDQPLLSLFSLLLPLSSEASELLPTVHAHCEGCELYYTPSVVCQDSVRVCICESGLNGIVGLQSQQFHSTAHAQSSPIRSLHGHRGYNGAIVLGVHTHTHTLGPHCVACAGYLLLACSSRFRSFSSCTMNKHIYSQQLVTMNGRQGWQQTPLKLVCNFSPSKTYFNAVINLAPVPTFCMIL